MRKFYLENWKPTGKVAEEWLETTSFADVIVWVKASLRLGLIPRILAWSATSEELELLRLMGARPG